jgi:hypothetical protein
MLVTVSTYIYIHMYLCMYIPVRIPIYACMYVHVYNYIHMYIPTRHISFKYAILTHANKKPLLLLYICSTTHLSTYDDLL